MGTVIGVAWYEAREWSRLRTIVPDPEKLEATHGEWLVFAEKSLADLRSAGHTVHKVPVTVAALQAWCELLGRRPDARARAEYTSDEVKRLHEAGLLPRDA
jgi:hypothetical protein